MGLAARQRGISLVTAIFVLVVLGALGGYMVSISGSQHYTSLHALQGAKAYHAARSGLEWGIASLSGDDCFAATTLLIDDMQVSLACEAADGVFRLQVLAQSGTLGSAGFAARQLEASISRDEP